MDTIDHARKGQFHVYSYKSNKLMGEHKAEENNNKNVLFDIEYIDTPL
jgi:hypothetical protein